MRPIIDACFCIPSNKGTTRKTSPGPFHTEGAFKTSKQNSKGTQSRMFYSALYKIFWAQRATRHKPDPSISGRISGSLFCNLAELGDRRRTASIIKRNHLTTELRRAFTALVILISWGEHHQAPSPV